jgi:hypothetical protein
LGEKCIIVSIFKLVIKPFYIKYSKDEFHNSPQEGHFMRDLFKEEKLPPIPLEVSALMEVLRLVVMLYYRAKRKELCSME